LETSGPSPFRHTVLSIGVAPFGENLPTLEIFVRPEKIEWTDYARTNFLKFQDDWEHDAVSPAEACEKLEAYFRELFGKQDATPVGHNIGFDVAFIRKLAFLGGRDQLMGLSHR